MRDECGRGRRGRRPDTRFPQPKGDGSTYLTQRQSTPSRSRVSGETISWDNFDLGSCRSWVGVKNTRPVGTTIRTLGGLGAFPGGASQTSCKGPTAYFLATQQPSNLGTTPIKMVSSHNFIFSEGAGKKSLAKVGSNAPCFLHQDLILPSASAAITLLCI